MAAKNLIIVESPTKIKSMKKIVGNAYDISATVGHVRDLPEKELGVDVEKGFTPTYVVMPGKKKVLRALAGQVRNHETILLACDPDREGEAIAWHIKEALDIPDTKYFRITTNEITAEGVRHALAHPRKIDMNLVNAQQARRILDRLVGYRISPILWRKIKGGLSAGRVQSIVVKLVVDREEEIEAFEPEEYWKITASCSKRENGGEPFTAHLVKRDGKKIHLGSEEETRVVLDEIRNRAFVVEAVDRRKAATSSPPPFKTSTMQRKASTLLRFSAKKTMQVAQRLYEGVDLGERGTTALITYMRTDSLHVSNTALEQCRDFILRTFGDEYLPARPRRYTSRQRTQEAHEAVRPTDVYLTPDRVEPHLPRDQFRLYRLIWNQFVASQMKNALYNATRVTIRAGRYAFTAQGREMVFDGYTRILGAVTKEMDKERIPSLAEGEELLVHAIDPSRRFTQPPKRYTQASLIATLEKNGIGRPSTYATILSTIQSRGYVTLENGSFRPTLLGRTVTEKLEEYFTDIMDVSFTARMEEDLDLIAEAKRDWLDVLRGFYDRFSVQLEKARRQMKSTRGENAEKTEHTCPKCGRTMVIRWGRRGAFLGCEGYLDPKEKCAYTMELEPDGSLKKDITGPLPGITYRGKAVEVKRSRYGYYLATPDGHTAPLPRSAKPEDLTEERVASLFEGRRTGNAARRLGVLEDGTEIDLRVGKFGPYLTITKEGKSRNVGLGKKTDPETFTLDDARAIISLPRLLGRDPESGEEVFLMHGTYGPYVKRGKKNASLKDISPSTVTLEKALELLGRRRTGK